MLYTNIREIITNLIDSNLATMLYYDSNEKPYSSFRFNNLSHYNGNDKSYNNYEPCIEFAGSGDYVGSTIDMANRRYIETEYPELFESDGIIYRYEGYGYKSLIIFFLRPSVVRSGLLDDLEGLPDYCLLNEEIESEIQQELLEESWDNWIDYDFECELEKLTGIEFIETNWQSDLFWEILSNGDGSEYYPETGEKIYVDMKKVFKNSDFVQAIIEHAELLETGEYRVSGNYKPVGYRLAYDWQYTGQCSWDDRQHVFNLHMKAKFDTVPDSILKEFGLKWTRESKLFWEVKHVNEVLKNIIKTGINSVVMLPYPVKPNCKYNFQKHNFCLNCHCESVCQVNDIDLCPECYNKLMNYAKNTETFY